MLTLPGRLRQIEWEELCSMPAMHPIAPQFCFLTNFHSPAMSLAGEKRKSRNGGVISEAGVHRLRNQPTGHSRP
jgi:hypothetical protein